MKILLSVAVALFLFGCSDNKQEQKNEVAPEKKEVVKAVEAVKQAEPVVEPVQAEPATKEVVKIEEKEQLKEAEKTVEKKQPKAPKKEVVKVEKKKVVEVAAPKTEAVEKKKQIVQAPSIDAKGLFTKKCASCHGAKAEKHALTKSQIIQGWKASKTQAALQGYKAKTYGGAMKSIMENKAKHLSDAEIKALADYITSL